MISTPPINQCRQPHHQGAKRAPSASMLRSSVRGFRLPAQASQGGAAHSSVQQALASVPALVEELLAQVPKGFGQFYPKEGSGGQEAAGGSSSSGAGRSKQGGFGLETRHAACDAACADG